MRPIASPAWIIVLAVLALLIPGVRAGGQSPGLVADHFPLNLSQAQALARADDAIRAAALTVDAPTSISRGGRNSYLTVIIHCIENGKTTLVDLEVADNGHPNECLAMRAFLSDFMKTGKAQAPSGEGFTGEWDTACYGGYKFKMRLVQKNGRVTGTYEQSGGMIDGTISGNVLRFRWTQTNGSKGTGRFTLSADRTSFAGFFGYEDDADKADRYWNGKRVGAPPAAGGGSGEPAGGVGFSGEWDTHSPGNYHIKFTQSGNRVTGTYEGGEIEGTVTGKVLRFHWKQTNGNKGTGKFTLSADGKSFTGVWTYGDDPDTATNAWNGTRIGAPAGEGKGANLPAGDPGKAVTPSELTSICKNGGRP